MISVRASLFARILFWSFLNLAAVGAVLAGFFALQFRFGPESILFAGNRLQYVAARLTADLQDETAEQRTAVLERYSANYAVAFVLFNASGTQIAGRPTVLPPVILDDVRAAAMLGGRGQFAPPMGSPLLGGPALGGRGPAAPRGDRGARPDERSPDDRVAGDAGRGERPQPDDLARGDRRPIGPGRGDGPAGDPTRPGPGGPPPGGGRDRMRPVQSIFQQKTTAPTRYWVGLRVPLFDSWGRRPTVATLLVVSDSLTGHGLFFDVRPWLLVAAAILLVTVAIWLPFVRGLTSSIGQMTEAAEEMARGRFDVRIDASRSDEVGRLGASINQLATRLATFVGGQKRFLGDISHELNTPLARLDVALGIIEERVGDTERATVADAQDEVRLMAQLVSELLAFAKAGMQGREVRLSPVPLRKLCEMVAAREAEGREVRVEVPADTVVTAHPELLARAIANLVRNAVRYAGTAGRIVVASRVSGDEAVVTVTDQGPGVPAEALPRLFEPFFRIEADRDRTTGGTGLGLAIVKTCVDACGGRVTARNLSPGFQVEIGLRL